MHDWTNAQYKYNIENLFIIVLKVSIWFVFFFSFYDVVSFSVCSHSRFVCVTILVQFI